jgi:hypothetical protein
MLNISFGTQRGAACSGRTGLKLVGQCRASVGLCFFIWPLEDLGSLLTHVHQSSIHFVDRTHSVAVQDFKVFKHAGYLS